MQETWSRQETWVWPLGGEEPLEKGMASHSSTPVWRTPWTEEPGSLLPIGLQRIANNSVFHFTGSCKLRLEGGARSYLSLNFESIFICRSVCYSWAPHRIVKAGAVSVLFAFFPQSLYKAWYFILCKQILCRMNGEERRLKIEKKINIFDFKQFKKWSSSLCKTP